MKYLNIYEISKYIFFLCSHPKQSLSILFPDHMSCINNYKYILGLLPDLYGYK